MFSSFSSLKKFRKFFKRSKPKTSESSSESQPGSENEAALVNEYPVLLLGTAGSGKSTLIKGLRMKSEARNDDFVQEMATQRKFLQYDLLSGIVKVMGRILSYENGEYEPLTDREEDVYGRAKLALMDVQSNGTLVATEDEDNYLETNESSLLALSSADWRVLKRFTEKEDFRRIQSERFLPDIDLSNMTGKPLRLTDGFAHFFEEDYGNNIWEQIVTGEQALEPETCLLLRNPNGGLFEKSLVKSMDRSSEVAFAFTEFPGRLESFTDILGNLQSEDGEGNLFKCIVLVLSYADFDNFVETDSGPELVNDYLFRLLGEINSSLKELSIYFIMTKESVFREKMKVYQEHSILDRQLKTVGITMENPNLENVLDWIKDDIEIKLKNIWMPNGIGRTREVCVKRFPRSFLIRKFDDEDVMEIFEHISDLSGLGNY